MSVLPEELMPQNVTALLVNMLTNKTSAETVTLNAKLVLLTIPVLNVLMIPTELTQKTVHVLMDIMKLELPLAQFVTTNVPLVTLMNNVLPVPTQESTHHLVIAQNICMMMLVNVKIVLSNAMDVTLTKLIVKNVLLTESMPQLAIAQLCTMMMESLLNVQNVVATVILVTLMDV